MFYAKLLGALVCIGLHAVSAFKNPIIPGFNPDPSITRVGKDYFLVTSTFEYFPGVPVYHSKDLIEWDLIGHALNRPSQLNMRGTAPSGGIYAPTLRYHEQTKTYYMITTWFDIISPPDTTRMPRSMYVKTKNIFDETSWSDPTYVDLPGFDGDLSFFNGKTYLSTTNGAGHVQPDSGYFSIWRNEIDLATGDSLTEPELFHVSTLPLDTPRLAEGSHFYFVNGYYYLFTAEGGTDNAHREMVQRSKSMNGPWEQHPENPILYNGRDSSASIQRTGHADLISTPSGKWYLVFLGTRPQTANGESPLGRETFMAPVTWKDGWPIVNGGNIITEDMPGLYNLARPKKFRDDFRGKLADKAYYTPRTPYKVFHTFPKSGGVRLKGNPYTLSDRETPAVLLRKQVDLNTIFSTELTFDPRNNTSYEAGVTLFLSIHFHNEIGITAHPETGRRTVVAKTRTGKTAALKTTYHEIPDAGAVRLYIKASPLKYQLGFAVGKAKVEWVAEVESQWLQTYLEGWQVFTGTFFGIYTTGNGWPILESSDFKYVQTELVQ